MKPRFLFVLACAIALAGCGSSSAGDDSSTPSTQSAIPTKSAATSPTSEALPTVSLPKPKSVTPRPIAGKSGAAGGSSYRQARRHLEAHQCRQAVGQFKASIAQGARLADSYGGLGEAAACLKDARTAYAAYRNAS